MSLSDANLRHSALIWIRCCPEGGRGGIPEMWDGKAGERIADILPRLIGLTA